MQLLPVSSPIMDRHTVLRKCIAVAEPSSYERYRAETVAPEIWDSTESLRVPRPWPPYPHRIHRAGSMFFLVAVTNLVVRLTPLVFLGKPSPCLSAQSGSMPRPWRLCCSWSQLGSSVFGVCALSVAVSRSLNMVRILLISRNLVQPYSQSYLQLFLRG
jgi:hypothetical protein